MSASFDAHIHLSSMLEYNASAELQPGAAGALKRMYDHLAARFGNRLMVQNFPLCSPPSAGCNPLQLKAEIDKVCLLKHGDPKLEPGERAELQALYLIANYVTGSTMTEVNKEKWLANPQCFEVQKHVAVRTESLGVKNAELDALVKVIRARFTKLDLYIEEEYKKLPKKPDM